MSDFIAPATRSTAIPLGVGHLGTNFSGIEQLWHFYSRARKHRDRDILVSLENVTGIDGNLCALIGVIICLLQKENNLTFSVSARQVKEKCEVLFANKFLNEIPDINVKHPRHSVKYRGFDQSEKDEFVNYLENELLAHEGMDDITSVGKDKIIDDMVELYGNIVKHAETDEPFFVCGQYFPEDGILKFTIADLGQGFFPKINQLFPDSIATDIQAIDWAMQGNSTKPDGPGGRGLVNIKNYLTRNNGYIQVFSGKGAWQSIKGGDPETILLQQNCAGATINLIFSKNNLNLDRSLRYG